MQRERREERGERKDSRDEEETGERREKQPNMNMRATARFQFVLAAFFTVSLPQISLAESEAGSGKPSHPPPSLLSLSP